MKDAPNAQVFKHTTSPPRVEFKDLCFYYVETNPILKSVSFIIPAGSNTAIVGASGFGKSTMSKLIFRHSYLTPSNQYFSIFNFLSLPLDSQHKINSTLEQEEVYKGFTID